MRKDKKTGDNKNRPTIDKERLAANMPISDWYDIKWKVAMLSRIVTESVRKSSKGVSS
ncbi:MAG: hypothetical protein ACE5H4_15030 [Candidatus Thorarchaeota archaeon]